MLQDEPISAAPPPSCRFGFSELPARYIVTTFTTMPVEPGFVNANILVYTFKYKNFGKVSQIDNYAIDVPWSRG
jgi:hypothetical protein